MPNWCFSSVVIEGNQEEIESLHKVMDTLQKMNKPSIENGFGPTWLGCLLNAIGKDWHNISCRGSWSDLSVEFNNNIGVLRFYTETAWRPMTEVFQAICEVYQSASYYFESEESGMGEYWTNDIGKKYFRDRYIVDMCTPDEHYCTEYFETLPKALEFLQDGEEMPIKSLQDVELMEEKWQEINPDSYCNVHEFLILNE